DDVGEETGRLAKLPRELLRAQRVDQVVVEAMASHLVPALMDPPDEVGVRLGDAAEDEERGAGAALREQVEEEVGLQLDTALERAPPPAGEIEVVSVEPFLDVDGEDIAHPAASLPESHAL